MKGQLGQRKIWRSFTENERRSYRIIRRVGPSKRELCVAGWWVRPRPAPPTHARKMARNEDGNQSQATLRSFPWVDGGRLLLLSQNPPVLAAYMMSSKCPRECGFAEGCIKDLSELLEIVFKALGCKSLRLEWRVNECVADNTESSVTPLDC